MQRMLWMAVVAGTLGLAGHANAASFEELDMNADGTVSQDEFATANPDAGKDVWIQIDANADGQVSEDEHKAAVQAGLVAAE